MTDASAPDVVVESSACLDGITTYDRRRSVRVRAAELDSVKLWVPIVPAGCKVPVVHLANGTGATCASYQDVLERLASHGFLTVVLSRRMAKAADCITAFETALQAYPDLAAHKLASLGHETGGAVASSDAYGRGTKDGVTRDDDRRPRDHARQWFRRRTPGLA